MTTQDEMDSPVTRRELREELAITRTGLREELAITRTELREEIRATENRLMSGLGAIVDQMATKDELALIRSQMATKDDLALIRSQMATKDDLALIRSQMATKDDLALLRGEMSQLRADLSTDIARHTNAILEHTRTMIGVIDDKYQGLPGRVTKLEEERNVPRPKRRRAAR
jgi:hypothetical protein